MTSPVILATRSEGKLRELRPLFAKAGWRVSDLREHGMAETESEARIEVYHTFEENALAKARYFHELTGCPVVADDSGLEVAALGGAPGVRSKRWSGRDDLAGQALDDANNAMLLDALRGVSDRRARYVCAAAYVAADVERVVRGRCEGQVRDTPSGAHGFGYDPYFVSDELGVTFADATTGEKERVSHRGRAFRALLAEIGGGIVGGGR